MLGIRQIYTQLCAPFLVIQFAMGEKEIICLEEAVTEGKGLLVTKWWQTMAEKCSTSDTVSEREGHCDGAQTSWTQTWCLQAVREGVQGELPS